MNIPINFIWMLHGLHCVITFGDFDGFLIHFPPPTYSILSFVDNNGNTTYNRIPMFIMWNHTLVNYSKRSQLTSILQNICIVFILLIWIFK